MNTLSHSPQVSPSGTPPDHGPSAPVLAFGALLAGIGTVMLGPLLPTLLTEWHLTDQRGGLLLAAKFVGACLGGLAVPRRLRLGIAGGHALAFAGFALFSLSHNLGTALPALLLSGFGLGEIIASTNILAGRRWQNHTGSALALLNLFWSLGAVSCGLLVSAFVPRFGWRQPCLAFAALFLLAGVAAILHTAVGSVPTPSIPEENASSASWRRMLPFGAMLFLYGGLETCLTAWLTTYTLRLGGIHLLAGQSAFVVLWSALTAGRVLASAAMRLWPEHVVLRVSLLLSLGLIALLIAAPEVRLLSAACVLLGIALAPVFPSSFGLLMQQRPPARMAGTLLAVSGLGAALFPWLMGVVSTTTGSLRVSMVVPILLAPLMLALSFALPRTGAPVTPGFPSPEGEVSEKIGV